MTDKEKFAKMAIIRKAVITQIMQINDIIMASELPLKRLNWENDFEHKNFDGLQRFILHIES